MIHPAIHQIKNGYVDPTPSQGKAQYDPSEGVRLLAELAYHSKMWKTLGWVVDAAPVVVRIKRDMSHYFRAGDRVTVTRKDVERYARQIHTPAWKLAALRGEEAGE